MKKLLAACVLTTVILGAAPKTPAKPMSTPRSPLKPAASAKEMPSAETSSELNQVSETFGHFLVNQLKTTPLQLNIALVIKGMQDEMAGKQAPMDKEAYEKAVTALQDKILKEMGAKNLAAAENFLKENAKKEGVVTLIDGKLQYKVLTPGSGAVVGPHDTPQIQYKGEFIDGTVFNSSYDSNTPVFLPLDQAIPGFAKGIVGMKEGEKRQLFVSPELAYGENGTANIPPNSLLIFTVEIIKANKPAETDTKK